VVCHERPSRGEFQAVPAGDGRGCALSRRPVIFATRESEEALP
jgi:hypothetical protein